MKKALIISGLLILLTGCGKNSKLVCTKTVDDEVSKIEYQNTFKFDSKKITNSTNKMTLTFSSDIKNNIKTFSEYGNNSMEQYIKQEGVEASLDTTDNSVILTVDYDVLKMSNDNVISNKLNYDYNKIKEEYISLGYTCK